MDSALVGGQLVRLYPSFVLQVWPDTPNRIMLRRPHSGRLEARTTALRASRHALRAFLSMTPEEFPFLGRSVP
jgi:hypothetical protein